MYSYFIIYTKDINTKYLQLDYQESNRIINFNDQNPYEKVKKIVYK